MSVNLDLAEMESSRIFYYQFKKLTATLIDEWINLGGIEFCCAGPDAERMHDTIDDQIEAKGAFQVATTGHEDLNDACDYFMHAAGGGTCQMLALIGDHAQIRSVLFPRLSFDPSQKMPG
jgi:hypothetical protein